MIAANAGGAWSPIGDVTTIMLWLGDKFTALEIIKYAFLPSLALFVVATSLLYRKLDDSDFTKREKDDIAPLLGSEKVVIATALGSFLLPLAMNTLGLPPYMGLLFGLGVTWCIIELAKKGGQTRTHSHLTANIDKIIQSVDVASIKYIIGILLAVMALSALGVLEWLSLAVVGESPSQTALIIINVGLGLLSGIIDNTSLVAIAMQTLPMSDPQLWALTAIEAGNGGSLMVIASAAGVVAMGNHKPLTVAKYFKIATIPAFLGLIAAVLVWYLQFAFVMS